MIKKIFVIILIFIFLCFFNSNYMELDDLVIIDSIEIDCNSMIYFREIIPYLDDNDMKYKYKKHSFIYITSMMSDNIYFSNNIKINNICEK